MAGYAVSVYAISGPDLANEMTHVYLGLQCAAALALVIAGRMWRRPPEALPSRAVPIEAGTVASTASP